MRRNVRERCTPADTIFTSRRESGLRSGCRNIRTSSVGQCGFSSSQEKSPPWAHGKCWKRRHSIRLRASGAFILIRPIWSMPSASREGAVAAAVDRFVITIAGVGCHGAHPDDGVDPIPAAAAHGSGISDDRDRQYNPFHPLTHQLLRGWKRAIPGM